MIHSKYRLNCRRNRDCTKCKKFGGMISKNYFMCKATMWEDQTEPGQYDIYDRDVLYKGSCNSYVPKEIDQDDSLHANDAMERMQQEDAANLLHKE